MIGDGGSLSADSSAAGLPKTCVVKECKSAVRDGVIAGDVDLELNPVGYALGQVTDRDYGNNRDPRRKWFQERQ